MKPSVVLLAVTLAGLAISVLAYLVGLSATGTAAGIVSLSAAGVGLAMANDASRHSGGSKRTLAPRGGHPVD